MKIKKGDKVTRIASWDDKGAVSVTHYEVRSAGPKIIHMIKLDGSNAKFEVYTPRVEHVQGLHSAVLVHTADYSAALARQWAERFIADQRARDEARWVHAQSDEVRAIYDKGGWDYADHLKFESDLIERHRADKLVPVVRL